MITVRLGLILIHANNNRYRNSRLKYMAKIPNASFMVKSAVGALGGFRPVIMGKGYVLFVCWLF